MKISFKSLSPEDYPLLLRWLETPHVKEWWDKHIHWTPELIQQKYNAHIANQKILPCLILADDFPIGYIQGYNAYDFPREQPLEALPSSLVAFDMYIGEVEYLGKGLGATAIVAFLDQYFAGQFKYALAEPDIRNQYALRSYEKAGFKTFKRFDTMIWMLKKLNETEENTILHNIQYKIYDRTSPITTGIYGRRRFIDTPYYNEVIQNQNHILEDMQAENILILEHVFGTEIIDADFVNDFSIEPAADAAITTRPGVLLSVQTADCVPVLLYDTDEKVIAAAHCSWHILNTSLIEELVNRMHQKGAKSVNAMMGPAIHQKNYEVGADFRDQILNVNPDAESLFIEGKRDNHWYFDLPAFCLLKLNKAGVVNCLNMCEDTYAHPDKYYSYRRDVHQGITGQQTNILSVIVLKS